MSNQKPSAGSSASKKKKKAARSKAGGGKRQQADEELFALLDQIDAAAEAGLALSVLGATKKDGSLTAAAEKRLDKLGLWPLVDRFGGGDGPGGAGGAGDPNDPVRCALNTAGRNRLATLREERDAAREAELRERLRSLDGLRAVLAQHAAGIRDLGRAADQLQADGQRIADLLESSLTETAADAAGNAGRDLGDTDFVRVAEAALAVPDDVPRATAAPGSSSGRTDLAQAVIRLVPDDHWLEIPELFRRLRAEGYVVLPGQLNDLLLALCEAGRIAFNVWMRTLTEIPAPEHGILQPDARVLYYVQRPRPTDP